MHPRDRLLTAVTALVQVRADQADLVGDRPVVGIDEEARLTALDAQRLVRPQAAGRAGRVTCHNAMGSNRVVDMLSGEQLPRIC